MNYMEQVAKMLGVEIGERFAINFRDYAYSCTDYYLCEDGLKCDSIDERCKGDLIDLLTGLDTIIKEPWKPKKGDRFFAYMPVPDKRTAVLFEFTWDYDSHNRLLYKIGDCYRTKKDAEKDYQKWYDLFESEEQVDVPGGVKGETD